MSLKDFEFLQLIGSGAYSKVYKVKRIIDQQFYALKKVKIVSLNQKQKQNSLNQVQILASFRHPNLIAFKQVFFQQRYLQQLSIYSIVMEYAEKGDLEQKIKFMKQNSKFLSQQFVWKILFDILKALNSLHSNNIFHRDIKSANIFLFENGIAKLGDMNVSKIIKQNSMYLTQTGTPYYASPEVWKDQPYNHKSDMWSLGCVLYEMISLRLPFRGSSMQDVFKKVTSGIYKKIPPHYSQQLGEIIDSLLQVYPEKRPQAKQLLKSKIMMSKIKDCESSLNKMNVECNMLRTIKFSKNLKQNLPQSNYYKQMELIFKPNLPKINKIADLKKQKELSKVSEKNEKDIQDLSNQIIKNKGILKYKAEQLDISKSERKVYNSERKLSKKTKKEKKLIIINSKKQKYSLPNIA